MNIKKLLLAAVCTIAGLAAVSNPVFADEAKEEGQKKPAVWLQVSPVSNRVTLQAGQKMEYEMTVANIGSEDFSYSVYATPYAVSDEEYNLNFSDETPRTQIARWIKVYDENDNPVEKAKFSIKTGDKQKIKYVIDVPEDIPAGGQYATLFAESDSQGDLGNASGVKTISRVGLVIYGRSNGETKDSAEINDMNIPTFMTEGKASASAKVVNSGNTDFNTKVNFTIKTIFGKTVEEKENTYSVLPDTTRKVSHEWDNTPFLGIFKVSYKVTALDKTSEQAKIVIIMPIFVLIIALLLLTFMIIWIIFMVRKRKERKTRIL